MYELAGTSERATLLTDLLPYFLPASSDESPVMTAFRNRLMALGVGFAEETDEAMAVIGEARARAESLQRDAQQWYRQTMGSLAQTRDELERRIDDLRAFEREYRSRLAAYLERQLSELRAGVADGRKFVLKKGSSGKYHFNLVASNGQVIATSETYENKELALNAIASIRYTASGADIDDQTSG